jgi:hypothetical protein
MLYFSILLWYELRILLRLAQTNYLRNKWKCTVICPEANKIRALQPARDRMGYFQLVVMLNLNRQWVIRYINSSMQLLISEVYNNYYSRSQTLYLHAEDRCGNVNLQNWELDKRGYKQHLYPFRPRLEAKCACPWVCLFNRCFERNTKERVGMRTCKLVNAEGSRIAASVRWARVRAAIQLCEPILYSSLNTAAVNLASTWFSCGFVLYNEWGWWSQRGDWLRAGRPRGRSWSLERDNISVLSTSSSPVLGLIRWYRGSFHRCKAAGGGWSWPLNSPSSRAEVRNTRIYTSFPHMSLWRSA